MKLSNTTRTAAAIFSLIASTIMYVMIWGLHLEAGTLKYLFQATYLFLNGEVNRADAASIMLILTFFYSISWYFGWVAKEAFLFLTDPSNC